MTTLAVRGASALLLTVLATLLLPASAAHALSCAADVPSSPYAFQGVVERTEHRSQLAHVRTDDGRQVVVDARPGNSMAPGEAWEVRYRVGERYEFHPDNATSPYIDGLCSRSRLLVSETLPSGQVHTVQRAVDTAPPAPPSPFSDGTLTLSAALAGVLLVAAVAWRWRRRRTSP